MTCFNLCSACRQWLSLLLLLAAAVVTFFMLTTISERFFCPAVELISEYLRLPPVGELPQLAGMTLAIQFSNAATRQCCCVTAPSAHLVAWAGLQTT
jgi:hypothetical protein